MMLKKMVMAMTKTQIGWMAAPPLMKRFISIMVFTPQEWRVSRRLRLLARSSHTARMMMTQVTSHWV